MCLYQLVPRSEWPDIPDEGWAWKMFVRGEGNRLCFPYRHFGDNDSVVPMDTLMISAGNRYIGSSFINPSGDIRYRAGFHMFLNEDDARDWISRGSFVVKRVRYGGILEIGYEDNQLVLVTKRLMVPSGGACSKIKK